jgi:hypothetical protein
MRIRNNQPGWVKHAKHTKPDGPHIKVTTHSVIGTHYGYCSDADDFGSYEEECVFYLPLGEYDFSKEEWFDGSGHCCCGSGISFILKSVETVV